MFDHLIAPEHIKQERLTICSTCENNIMNICSKCGCILKLKTQWASTKCPADKWFKYEAP